MNRLLDTASTKTTTQGTLSATPSATSLKLLAIAGLGAVVLLSSALAWASVAKVDIVVVARGETVAPVQPQTVRASGVGQLRSILVKAGAQVVKGQSVAELDNRQAETDLVELNRQLLVAQADIAVHEALLSGASLATVALVEGLEGQRQSIVQRVTTSRTQLASQLNEQRQRIAEIDAALSGVSSERATLMAQRIAGLERLQKFEALAKRGFVARNRVEDMRLAQRQLEGESERLNSRQMQLTAQREAVSVGVQQLSNDTRNDWSEVVRSQLDQVQALTNRRTKIELQLETKTLTAPIDGTVQEVHSGLAGTFISAGEPLLVVVPETTELSVKTNVANKDLAFLEPGQFARVKLDAYPFSRHGVVTGQLSQLAQTSNQTTPLTDDPNAVAGFPAEIALHSPKMQLSDRSVDLSAGMQATVEITTGSRSVLSLVLSPMKRFADDAGQER